MKLVLHYLPTLHHKLHSFELGDVGQGISRDRHQIGESSGGDRANAIFPAHQPGGLRSCSPDRLRGLHAKLHQVFEFFGLGAMRKRADP